MIVLPALFGRPLLQHRRLQSIVHAFLPHPQLSIHISYQLTQNTTELTSRSTLNPVLINLDNCDNGSSMLGGPLLPHRPMPSAHY